MNKNENEAVEAALGLALSDWNKNWEGYQQAQIKFRPFQDEDESSIKTAATILATEVRRLREENERLEGVVEELTYEQLAIQAERS